MTKRTRPNAQNGFPSWLLIVSRTPVWRCALRAKSVRILEHGVDGETVELPKEEVAAMLAKMRAMSW